MQIKLFKDSVNNNYSVRKVEEIVKKIKEGDDIQRSKNPSSSKRLPEEFNLLKDRLSRFLNTKVDMTYSAKGKGSIKIPFANEKELEHIMNIFDRLNEE